MNKIREWLRGKKSYIVAVIGFLGAVVAWTEGSISGTGLLAALWAAAQTCFLRAGLANEVAKVQE